MINYKIISKDVNSRAGILYTNHGFIETPVFMPVGTQGTIKSISSKEIESLGVQVILGNTYHLYLNPSVKIINNFNGLHSFMNWDKSILTDSGGFQCFSLSKLGKITKNGYVFKSHIDGKKHMFTPEKCVRIQTELNSDIMMSLDQCIKYPASFDEIMKSTDITYKWAKKSKKYWIDQTFKKNYLFGIIQGGMHKKLRSKSLNEIVNIGFPGYAIGGLSVGEPRNLMMEISEHTLSKLPKDKPRYIMGVGKPEDIVDLIALGADMFDCVIPTRNARNGQLFTNFGTINISNKIYEKDKMPIDVSCECYTCSNYTKAYLRHLFLSKEILSYSLNTIHNISYYVNLINEARKSILSKNYFSFKKNFYEKREQGLDFSTSN